MSPYSAAAAAASAAANAATAAAGQASGWAVAGCPHVDPRLTPGCPRLV